MNDAILNDIQPPVRAVRLIEADADFGRAIPAEDIELAQRALAVREISIRPGESVTCTTDCVAVVVLEGALWREVRLGAVRGPQLLGAGSVLLPDPPPSDLLDLRTETTSLTRARLGVLDRRFMLACTRWPGLMSILHARLAQQERDLGVLAAIGQLPRVDERIMALMWHLAERWGTVGADGIHVPLRLTHATLGRFVAARRPTVSLALTELREAGRLAREADGTWTLQGPPPTATTLSEIDARDRTGPPDLFPGAALADGSA